jgi:hypothetical protein
MSHLGQRHRELRHAFRHPHQGPHGIAQCRRFDQPLERRDEPRVGFRHRPTPASGAANPSLRKRLAVEVVFAAIDRRTSEPGNLRDQRETAASRPGCSPSFSILCAADVGCQEPNEPDRRPLISPLPKSLEYKRRIVANGSPNSSFGKAACEPELSRRATLPGRTPAALPLNTLRYLPCNIL